MFQLTQPLSGALNDDDDKMKNFGELIRKGY
jgi:hypothetical protein